MDAKMKIEKNPTRLLTFRASVNSRIRSYESFWNSIGLDKLLEDKMTSRDCIQPLNRKLMFLTRKIESFRIKVGRCRTGEDFETIFNHVMEESAKAPENARTFLANHAFRHVPVPDSVDRFHTDKDSKIEEVFLTMTARNLSGYAHTWENALTALEKYETFWNVYKSEKKEAKSEFEVVAQVYIHQKLLIVEQTVADFCVQISQTTSVHKLWKIAKFLDVQLANAEAEKLAIMDHVAKTLGDAKLFKLEKRMNVMTLTEVPGCSGPPPPYQETEEDDVAESLSNLKIDKK